MITIANFRLQLVNRGTHFVNWRKKEAASMKGSGFVLLSFVFMVSLLHGGITHCALIIAVPLLYQLGIELYRPMWRFVFLEN